MVVDLRNVIDRMYFSWQGPTAIFNVAILIMEQNPPTVKKVCPERSG